MKTPAEILKQRGISPTPVRILVLGSLLKAKAPISLSGIEMDLETVDKSSISRCLNLFREKHVVHGFNDGSGSVKYEICKSDGHSELDDRHVHFRCEECGNTFCLTSISIPDIVLPPGFLSHEACYIVSGICAECSHD